MMVIVMVGHIMGMVTVMMVMIVMVLIMIVVVVAVFGGGTRTGGHRSLSRKLKTVSRNGCPCYLREGSLPNGRD